MMYISSVQFGRLVMSDSATPRTVGSQSSLSITNSWSSSKLMSIESIMPSNHLILCHPLLLLPLIFAAPGSFPMSRLLRVLWTARGSNQSILKEINPEYSLEGLRLKLKLLMQRTDSLEKTLMLGKIEGKRRRGQQRMRWLESITDSMDMNLSKV